MSLNKFKQTTLALSVALLAVPAWAVPALQLGIQGGTYDSSTQTIFASGNSFSVVAYGLAGTAPIGDKYFLSVALLGAQQAGGSFGSFTVNGNTFNATADMTWGTPPLDDALREWDPGDLAKHSIFPTYFKEFGFYFSGSQQSGVFNTQDHPSWGPQSGTGLYYQQFDINISGLAPGQGLHFDLYSEKFNKKNGLLNGDTDVNRFAPFSHDAEAHVTAVPEPETYAMLLAGLGLLGFTARHRKQKAA